MIMSSPKRAYGEAQEAQTSNRSSPTLADPPLIIVPGLGNSGPDHWQTWLEKTSPNTHRVEQDDWRTPSVKRWARNVSAAIDAHREAIVVAHSFGCIAAAAAITAAPSRAAAALLVAPADPDLLNCLSEAPAEPLLVRTFVVASQNDPWMSFAAAQEWSRIWRAELIDAGHAGHINPASGYGHWPELLTLLDRLIHTSRDINPCFSSVLV